jgi:hypothetical protein
MNIWIVLRNKGNKENGYLIKSPTSNDQLTFPPHRYTSFIKQPTTGMQNVECRPEL